MAHDIFDFNDGWDQEDQPEGPDLIDLERDAEKQRQELLAQQWRDGELFVTTDYVLIYENPTDPSPIVEEFEPDTVILLSSLQDSTNYGGFRDVLLPIRGWVWTSVDEYDKAFHDASMMLKNVPTRETSTSIMRMANYAKRKLRKHKNKKKHSKKHSDENINKSTGNITVDNNNNNNTDNIFDQETRDYAQSDAAILNLDKHNRQKTNHLYVNPKQRELKQKKKKKKLIKINASAEKVPSSSNITNRTESQHFSYQSNEFSESHEFSSKFRRMSHQVTYNPAGIKKIERPLSLEELDKLKEEQDIDHLKTDSAGNILGIENEMQKQLSERGAEKNMDNKLTEIDETAVQEQESLGNKIINSIYIRKLVHFVRSHPALLTFVYIVFTGFVEFLIFFDIITDVIVAGGLFASGYQSFFVVSAVLVITPYFIAWSSLWGLIEKKREQVGKDKNSKHIIFKNIRRYKIFVTLFSFAPLGVIMLMLFDVWIIFEFILIRPLYFFMRFKLFRSDTFEELGYRKLRRVSEVCSETLFQAVIQLLVLLLLRKDKKGGGGAAASTNTTGERGAGITTFDVVLSLLASFFVIFLWFGIILRFEASSNGIALVEYLPIVLQGSFKFVPFLPAIEKGTKNGLAVNWCLFKFDLNALSALGKSLGAPYCNLKLIKCSTKTFKKLPRFGCKLFGRLMNTALSQPINVIISRLDTDMEELFRLFDTGDTKYFNFINFCRATLALRAQDNELLKYQEISSIFYELAGSKKYEYYGDENEENKKKNKQQKVWLLDLMLKFRTAKEYVSILDIQQPEDYCVKKQDVNLLTFVRSMGYQSDNHDKNVILAVCQNNLEIAHVLTEDDGIPIVVEITEGRELLASYMNFHKPNDNDNDNDNDKPVEKYNKFDDNNMLRVQQYHKLNQIRKNNNRSGSAMDAFDAIFSDVSIYVSVAMCEIEKTTTTTKETINQFWNEKLLFIIPYSVIDEIKSDATHTLVRDTEHRDHYSNISSIYGIVGGNELLKHYIHTGGHNQSQRQSLPPIKLPYNQNSESLKSKDKTKKKKKKKVSYANAPTQQTPPPIDNDDDINDNNTVRFNHVNTVHVIDIQDDDDDNYTHETTGTMHIKTTCINNENENENENETIFDNDNDEMDDNNDDEIPKMHHTGLTEKFENLFQPSPRLKETVPSESPNASAENLMSSTKIVKQEIKDNISASINEEKKHTEIEILKTPSIDPKLHTKMSSSLHIDPRLVHNNNAPGRESALRDSLHLNKFTRQGSILPGTLIPHFEKKIYLDFNLFDDSGVNNQNSGHTNNSSQGLHDMPNAYWDFKPTQSTGSIRNNNQNKKNVRRTGSGLNKKVARNVLKMNKSKSYNQDSGDEFNSDSDEEEKINPSFGVNTPRTPINAVFNNDNSGNNGGIDGGEGTFLGSAHISINIDDPEKLSTHHTILQEKEIKIGKKYGKNKIGNKIGNNNNDEKESKLKFKIYCNALSAYLIHGKNYGDRLRELEIMEDVQRINQS